VPNEGRSLGIGPLVFLLGSCFGGLMDGLGSRVRVLGSLALPCVASSVYFEGRLHREPGALLLGRYLPATGGFSWSVRSVASRWASVPQVPFFFLSVFPPPQAGARNGCRAHCRVQYWMTAPNRFSPGAGTDPSMTVPVPCGSAPPMHDDLTIRQLSLSAHTWLVDVAPRPIREAIYFATLSPGS
jgi:hypothetical protein